MSHPTSMSAAQRTSRTSQTTPPAGGRDQEPRPSILRPRGREAARGDAGEDGPGARDAIGPAGFSSCAWTDRAPRVLVVDDDPGVRKALCRTLRREGWLIESASDAWTAARAFSTAGFDLVVSDENMPGRTGTELFAELRDLSSTVRLVLMTGAPGLVDSDKIGPLGVSGIVQKPWDRGDLIAALRAALR